MRVFCFYLTSDETIKVKAPFEFLARFILSLKGHKNYQYVGSWKES